MRRWLWLLGSLLILAVLPLLAQSPDGAHWRLGHFAVDVPEVDVYLDNTLVLQQVKLAAINGWRDLASGPHTITITPTGGALDRPLVLPFTFNVQAGEWVTLALAGRRSDGTLKLHAVVEDMRPIATGLARLSVFNAFPNNPPLNIRLGDVEIVRRLAYPGTINGNDGLETREVLAGSYSLTIELSTDGQLVKELPSVGLGVSRSYLLVIFGTLDRPFPVLVATEISASGTPNVPVGSVPVIVPTSTLLNTPVVVIPTNTPDAPTESSPVAQETASESSPSVPEATVTSALVQPTVTLAVAAPQGNIANVRFGHFAPGTPPITFYLDGSEIDTLDTSSGTALSEYQPLPSGAHTLSLVLAGETLDQAFLRQSVSFGGGENYLVAAIGSLDIGSFTVVTAREDIYPLPGEAKIGFFNAMPDVPKMALFNDRTGGLVFTRVAFALAYENAGTGYISAGILPGRYRFTVAENLDDINVDFDMLKSLEELRLGEGRYYTIVITGLKDQANQPYMIFDSYQPPVTATPRASATPEG